LVPVVSGPVFLQYKLTFPHTLVHFTPAFEDGTDRVFRNVGIYKSDAGESPKRKQTTFWTRRKLEIKVYVVLRVNFKTRWCSTSLVASGWRSEKRWASLGCRRRRQTAKISNIQSPTADRGWSSRLGV